MRQFKNSREFNLKDHIEEIESNEEGMDFIVYKFPFNLKYVPYLSKKGKYVLSCEGQIVECSASHIIIKTAIIEHCDKLIMERLPDIVK